jgi:hypothetical protein
VDDKINVTEWQEPPSKVRPAPDRIAIAILFGLVVLITISALNLYETHRQRNEFTDRMTQVLNAVNARLTANPANPNNPPPRPPGPDPDKVYTVRTQGAAARGPNGAPIKIAEFSDFQ